MNQLTSLMEQLTPYSVGFDNMVNNVINMGLDTNAYPPYNIAKTGDNTYAIQLAVAGLSTTDLEIEYEPGCLTIKYNRPVKPILNNAYSFIYRGISARKFTKQFRLTEDIKVANAKCEYGLLTISLEREVLDKRSPQKINIT